MNFQNQYQEFPVHLPPPSIRLPALEMQRNEQVPLALIIMAIFTALSLCCQQLIDVNRWGNLTSPVSLFLMLIAESGERKTRIDTLVLRLIRAFQSRMAREYEKQDEVYLVELLAWKEEEKA